MIAGFVSLAVVACVLVWLFDQVQKSHTMAKLQVGTTSRTIASIYGKPARAFNTWDEFAAWQWRDAANQETSPRDLKQVWIYRSAFVHNTALCFDSSDQLVAKYFRGVGGRD
jgi:hypothetical protein